MNRTLPDLFDAFLLKSGAPVSFQAAGTLWSPTVLSQRVSQWAQMLIELGVKPGDRVGIYLRKSLEEMGLICAIAQVGAVFVTIHPSNKFQQLQHILTDCDIQVLLSSSSLLRALGPALATLPLTHIVVTDHADGLQAPGTLHSLQAAEELPGLLPSSRPRIIDNDFATILYTSGSTGKPKGIIQTHGNLVEGAEIVSSYVKNVPQDRVLSLLPLSFDYGLNQLLSALYVGFSLVLAEYVFPLDILRLLHHKQITGLAGVPTIWLDLLGVLETSPEVELPHFRYITNSGGKLYPTTVQRLRQRLPATEIYLMYGLTEAFRSTYLPPEYVDRHPDSIGRAIPNVSIHVINEHGKECAPAEVGELIHRGALISKGYWGNKAKTDQVLRPHPLLPASLQWTETVVYSGDLVWRDEEGFLYYVGRKDNMIKTAGHRVSPDEITEVLLRLDGVENAAVIGVEHEHLGQKIVAFLQVPETSSLTEQACKAFVKKSLPSHMVPAEVQLLSEFPRNTNGKVDLVELKKRVSHAQCSV